MSIPIHALVSMSVSNWLRRTMTVGASIPRLWSGQIMAVHWTPFLRVTLLALQLPSRFQYPRTSDVVKVGEHVCRVLSVTADACREGDMLRAWQEASNSRIGASDFELVHSDLKHDSDLFVVFDIVGPSSCWFFSF